jgi:hypothetical protein
LPRFARNDGSHHKKDYIPWFRKHYILAAFLPRKENQGVRLVDFQLYL